mgnify:CR=1 FL=1|tara:strand:- start:625 stop:801 length:177 start_codon:yes stop_codon:yes gene_type:complete
METKIKDIEKRLKDLENKFNNFMDSWGPETQKKRDQRDAVWDEMVRVITIQNRKNNSK